ncbi:unnamed protein product [Closterium sp. NIES-64]|nr:unnamed protein product [Closterium sp. NIES-64]
MDHLLARMWEEMGLVRVYTKPQGQQPDFADPVVLSTCITPGLVSTMLMGLVRVYTKPQGQQPDCADPIVLSTIGARASVPKLQGQQQPDFVDPVVLSTDRGGCTVRDFCDHIHRGLLKDVKYVLCWGISVKHYPQRCGLAHVLRDEDVVQIVKKKVMCFLDSIWMLRVC